MEREYHPDPGIAAVLSFLFTGLGQIYNGQIGKGLILMSISAVCMLVLIVGAAIIANILLGLIDVSFNGLLLGSVLIIISLLFIAITGIYNIYDSYNTAKGKM